MKGLTIIKLSAFAVVILSMIGCKTEINQKTDQDENDLTFTASTISAVGPAGAQSKSESTLDEFTTGCSIGLFTQFKSSSDALSEAVIKSNALYNYATPVWTPISKDDKLTYDGANNMPIYVFGYYPHPSMTGATTTIANGSTKVDYTLHKNQSSALSVKLSDLLWVGAKNNGNGYVRQRTPIKLMFEHRLCKVSFYVRLVDSDPGQNNPTKAYLRNIATIGEQINDKAVLNVLTGQLIPIKGGTPKVDSVYWNSTSDKGAELIVGADPVYVTDMLLIPFTAVASKNYFRTMLYYEAENVVQNFNAYIPQYDPTATTGGSMLRFEPNKHNKVTITIDISDMFMNISAEIAPWDLGPNVDLPSEPV